MNNSRRKTLLQAGGTAWIMYGNQPCEVVVSRIENLGDGTDLIKFRCGTQRNSTQVGISKTDLRIKIFGK